MSVATTMESGRAVAVAPASTTVGFIVRTAPLVVPPASPFSLSALASTAAPTPTSGMGGAIAIPAAAPAAPLVIPGLSPPPVSILTSPARPAASSNSGSTSTAAMATTPGVAAGWQGLLEISRNSGMSGIMGAKTPAEDDTKLEITCTAHTSPGVRRLVKGVIRGLKSCQEPEKALEGMGGTYFFMNENGRKAAILKPCDEEPLAPNNPKGYVGRALGEPGWKPTVRVGEAAMREVAAYLLDHDGWCNVPTTALVRARHPVFCYNSRMSSVRQSSFDLVDLEGAGGSGEMSMDGTRASDASTATVMGQDCDGGFPANAPLPMKLGSLQEFVAHICDTSEMGPAKFTARDVHRIGILDIRLFNTDRHAGNMLVRPAARSPGSAVNLRGLPALGDSLYELVPIDHGFCLPETLEACYFEWLHWPQAMLPFTDEELEYIARLDVEEDKQLLRRELPNLRPECLRVMELATTLLQRCAAAGLTLFEIASVMTRPYEGGQEEPSELEHLAAAARAALQVEEAEEACARASCDDAIAEDDSEGQSGSDQDDEGLEADVEVEVLGALGAEGCMMRAPPPPVLTQASSREEDSMLFDLDEDGTPRAAAAAGPHAVTASGVVATVAPHTVLSLGSSLSSSADGFSFGPRSSGSPMVTGTPYISGLRAPSDVHGPPASAVAMATSVHVAEGGFLWRRLKARAAAKRRGNKRAGGMAHGTPGARCVYPPPVAVCAPDALNGLFSDMDDMRWERFMALWLAALNERLASGALKKGLAKDESAAQSCPRF